MRKILLFIAMTAAVVACAPSYRLMVSEPEEGSRSFYTPMMKVKPTNYLIRYWRTGTPVLERNEAMLQIYQWQKEQAHIKRARKPHYIKVK